MKREYWDKNEGWESGYMEECILKALAIKDKETADKVAKLKEWINKTDYNRRDGFVTKMGLIKKINKIFGEKAKVKKK